MAAESAAVPMEEPERRIELRGVRVRNLQNIDVDFPLGKLTVISGVSGAGKSSLAFDTLYAEGQRRFIQCLSISARRALEQMEPPLADRISDLPPAIAIRQTQREASPRATVATMAEIHDDLRILYARLGQIRCPDCRLLVTRDSPTSVAQTLSRSVADGARLLVCAPWQSAGEPDAASLAVLRESGFIRAIAGGQTLDLNTLPPTMPTGPWLIVVDRVVMGQTTSARLLESLETAFSQGLGRAVVLAASQGETPAADQAVVNVDGRDWVEHRFASDLVCPNCGREFLVPEPRLFNFNSPLGACPVCHGLGFVKVDGGRQICEECHGARLQPQARAVEWQGESLPSLLRWTIGELQARLATMKLDSPSTATGPLESVRQHLLSRVNYLASVGLGHLTLDRPIGTLSAGETRRVLMTAALGSQMVNALYVLDEPSAGLHPRDAEGLRAAILRLRDAGNTVVIVDHERDLVEHADHFLVLGPAAGRDGGQVIYQGVPRAEDFAKTPSPARQISASATCLKLSGVTHRNLRNLTVEFPLGVLCVVTGVSGSGKSSLVCQTLYPALATELARRGAGQANTGKPARTTNAAEKAALTLEDGGFERLEGTGQLDAVLLLDQQPLTRSPRSNAATLLGVFNEIRGLFAQTAEAQVRNYGAGHFSFNAASGGRCPTCDGAGKLEIDLQFLPDVRMSCPDCHGTRFRKEILEVKYRGLNIAEVLNLTAREAFPFFRGLPRVQRRLRVLKDVGLDYLPLGQSLDSLSGGESQRLKLALALTRHSRARTLLILDEPTVGLHAADVDRLLEVFRLLVETGHSLVVIDHNLAVLRAADHLMELGPGAGSMGGKIVALGTPAAVTTSPHSVIGQWLAASQ